MTAPEDDELIARLRAMVCEALRVDAERVTPDASLLELGADSLDITQLVLDIEEAFGVTIPESDAPKLLTLAGAAAYLRGQTSASTNDVPQARDAAVPRPEPLRTSPHVARRERRNDVRVVITGLGAITPIGHSARASFEAALAGRSGLGRHPTEGDRSPSPKLSALVRDFDPDRVLGAQDARRHARFTQLALAASREALADADFERAGIDPTRIGTILGVGFGDLAIVSEGAVTYANGEFRLAPLLLPALLPNIAAGTVATHVGARGPCYSTCSACASSAHALGNALELLRTGVVDAVVAGGAEACVTPLSLTAFQRTGTLSKRYDDPEHACRPFDRARDGFVMGEGAGVLVLETLECAQRRGARIYAELAGAGASADAYHSVHPDPEGRGAAEAMAAALADADLPPDAVGYVNAHGTGTMLNDRVEAMAIRRVFGAHVASLAVSSTKAVTGHLLGAAGAVEAIFTTLALAEGKIPPTMNLTDPDPECDLDFVPLVAREKSIEVALTNSFAFGGQNASLVLRRSP